MKILGVVHTGDADLPNFPLEGVAKKEEKIQHMRSSTAGPSPNEHTAKPWQDEGISKEGKSMQDFPADG